MTSVKHPMRVFVDVERTAYGLADTPMDWGLAEKIAEQADDLLAHLEFYYDDEGSVLVVMGE